MISVKRKKLAFLLAAFLLLSILSTAMAEECVNVAGRWLIHSEGTKWCEGDHGPQHESFDGIWFVQQTGCAIYDSGTWIMMIDGLPAREEYHVWGTVSNNLVNVRDETVSYDVNGRVDAYCNGLASGRLSDGFIEGTGFTDCINIIN